MELLISLIALAFALVAALNTFNAYKTARSMRQTLANLQTTHTNLQLMQKRQEESAAGALKNIADHLDAEIARHEIAKKEARFQEELEDARHR